MRAAALLCILVGCSSPDDSNVQPDAAVTADAVEADALPNDSAPGLFGELSGMCGVLTNTELLGPNPLLVQDAFTFDRAFMDPADRGQLTPGGMVLIDTPNAGGSSELSELFAYEQLARCEDAMLIKTETQVTYQNPMGKKTDILVSIDGHKIGVSVTRAFAFPIGTPYSENQARTLLTEKLQGIQSSTANVTPADAWEKQILAYQAIDDQTAAMVVQVWDSLDAGVKADTILLLTTTNGSDLFLYQN